MRYYFTNLILPAFIGRHHDLLETNWWLLSSLEASTLNAEKRSLVMVSSALRTERQSSHFAMNQDVGFMRIALHEAFYWTLGLKGIFRKEISRSSRI